MKTSQEGIAIIKAFESCLKKTGDGRYTTYLCPANVLTIGWGTTRSDVPGLKPGEIWTRERCDDEFALSLGKYEGYVQPFVSGAGLNPMQASALVSLVYNCGPGALNGSIGAALREKRFIDVPRLMARWNKAAGRELAGLTRRRKAEGLLFQGKVSEAFSVAGVAKMAADPMPQKIDVPKPSVADAVAETVRKGAKELTVSAAGGGGLWTWWTSLDTAAQVGIALAGAAIVSIMAIGVYRRVRHELENWA